MREGGESVSAPFVGLATLCRQDTPTSVGLFADGTILGACERAAGNAAPALSPSSRVLYEHRKI